MGYYVDSLDMLPFGNNNFGIIRGLPAVSSISFAPKTSVSADSHQESVLTPQCQDGTQPRSQDAQMTFFCTACQLANALNDQVPTEQCGDGFRIRGAFHHAVAMVTTSVMLLVGGATAADNVTEVRFAGVLSEAGTGADAIVRRFEALLLNSPQQKFFLVIDDARSGCPWPDSFGLVAAAGAAETVQPHLLYVYDSRPVSIHLPPLVVELPQDIAVESRWQDGLWTYQAVDETQLDGTVVWQINASERRGRRQDITVDAKTGLLVQAKLDVFMGRGDRFVLSLQRTESQDLTPPESQRITATESLLLNLQTTMKRRADSQHRNLTPRQVAAVEQQLPDLLAAAGESPLTELVQRIQTDLTRQQARLQAGTAQADKMIGQKAPQFSLNLIDGTVLDSDDTQGGMTVLHFWDYRNTSLSEPYGQTGYLEFLHSQDRAQPIRVIGVSTNAEFHSADTLGRAKRSARKLAEFMNLSYEIGYDDGALLRSMGDPREAAGQLPLWVVINPDGRIVHYHTGHYEIDAREGLKELRAQLQNGN
jgi:peroxiredoxin